MAGLHQEKIEWLEGQLYGAESWLDNFGHGSRRPYPDHEIAAKEHRVSMLRAIRQLIIELQNERARG